MHTKLSVTRIKRKALSKQEAPFSLRDLSNRCLFWGDEHTTPSKLIGTIQRSPSASRCFVKLQEYTYGDGFKDEQLKAEKVNPDETFNELLIKTTSPLWKLGGFSWVIKWDLSAEEMRPVINRVYSIPFESVRLGIPDDRGEVRYFIYNPYFGTDEYQPKYNEFYGEFTDNPAEMESQKELAKSMGYAYGGQILWFAHNTEYSRFYPRPFWAGDNNNDGGGFQAMENDFLLTRLLGRDLGQGFLQNVVMKMVGDPDQPIVDHIDLAANGKSYTSIGDEFKREMERDFQGIDGDTMLVLWSKMKEQFPELEAFPTNFNYEKLKDVAEQVQHQVVTALQVPPVLAGIQTSGSISKDDITSAAYLMYSVVRMNQYILENAFSKILRYWKNTALAGADIKIENYRPFPEQEQIDPLVWAEMTSEERRKWIAENTNITLMEVAPALEAAQETGVNETLTNLTGRQLQNIERIVRKFKREQLTFDQAATMLKDGFGFNDDQIAVWLQLDFDAEEEEA